MQLGRTDENRIIFLKILCAGILGGVQLFQTDLGNFIIQLYVIHEKALLCYLCLRFLERSDVK